MRLQRRAQTSVEYTLLIVVLVLGLITAANTFNWQVGNAMRVFAKGASSAYTSGELANGS